MMMITIDKLYNLQSFDTAKDYFKSQDSAGGTILARSLEHISAEVFKQRIAGLSFLTGTGIEVNNEGGYAKNITKLKESVMGDFRDAGDNTNGTGKISVGVEDDTIPVFFKDAGSEWSQIDLERASLENRNLVASFIAAHDQKYKEAIDTIGYIGNGTKTTGLLNFAGFTSTASAKTFALLTGQEMYDEIKDLVMTQRASVLNDEVFSCNKIALHPATYNLLVGTFLNTAGGIATIADAIKTALNVEFVLTSKALIGGVYRVVAYSSNRQAMQTRIPVPLMISNQYTQGFKHQIESMFGVAGVDIMENGAGYILTGV